MEFAAPQNIDFEDIFELNVSFLRLMQNRSVAARLLRDPAEPMLAELGNLHERQIQRLARCPFLLCCCREDDIEFWQSGLKSEQNADLFTEDPAISQGESQLIAAALGFAWQLVRRNPYAARIACGASTAWCDEIAAQPFIRLVSAAARMPNVLSVRFSTDGYFWRRLMLHGLHRDPATRRAARITALNTILLRERPAIRFAAAARSTNAPTLLLRS